MAAQIPDWRRGPVHHLLESLVRQRVYQIVCGDEDQNAASTARTGPLLKLVCGRMLDSSAELASQPTLERLEHAVSVCTCSRLAQALLDVYLQEHERANGGGPPARMLLDWDGTDDPTPGIQEGGAYYGYCRQHRYHPLLIFDGGADQLVTAILRPGTAHASRGVVALLRRLVRRLRARWPAVTSELRADSGGGVPRAAAPRSLAAGIDTWCLNRLVDDDALPPRLRHQLDEMQRQVQEDDDEVETPWIFDDVPLRMYRAGVSAAQGGGVSWSYILRNPSLALRIRRVPLGGIIAHARLGSECLWRLTDRAALDRLDALVRGMWGRSATGQARWQVSEVHLAHDVANAPIEREHLDRYVSRSRRDATYDASQQQMQQLLAEVYADDPALLDDFPIVDWDAHYEALFADKYGADENEEDDSDETAGDLAEGDPIEERAVTAHRWGKRLSGVTWSPGGATSLVQYNKALECRLTGKNHMQTIWNAAGWQPEEGATRYEVRVRREALRELKLLGPDGQARACLDDPWEFLQHKKEVFAAVVGRAEESPDAVNLAWIRLVVPQDDDTNSSRWPTDPLWRIVQDAPFADVPAEVRRLIRRKQRAQDVDKLDGMIYGCLASRVSLKHPNAGEWDISAALAEVAPALIRRSELPNKDFGTLARERRRERSLPVPLHEKLLRNVNRAQ